MAMNKQRLPRSHGRIDWKSERDRVDMAGVATRLLGPAMGRRGYRGRLLWWRCPLGKHEDANPSFHVDPGKASWHCFGCGENGDAATLVMAVTGASFPEALQALIGEAPLASRSDSRSVRAMPPPAPSPPTRSGMTPEAALKLVEESAARLWGPAGATSMAMLTGPSRGLTAETIAAARLGVTPGILVPAGNGARATRLGLVIPWFGRDGRLALLKIRQPEGRAPKYAEVFRDPSALTGLYPGPGAIRAGRALIIVEGEFDCLLLGQALAGVASVVTLGSASARPTPALMGPMLAAAPWFIATDADPAGDTTAAGWPAAARRVRPPGPWKDWCEAHGAGVSIGRWWADALSGDRAPELFTNEEASTWRWGPALDDGLPGIHARGLDRPRLHQILAQAAATSDDRAREERLAMLGEYG